ncbi:MAG: hypothetical protein GHCLOJNM_03983 [bacterium]|nr:hypothetical protein [bacterium]
MNDETAHSEAPEKPLVEVFNPEDEIEAAIVQEALSDAGIHFVFLSDQDRILLGIQDGRHDFGVIQVLEEDADRAIEVIQTVLPGETEVEFVEEEEES